MRVIFTQINQDLWGQMWGQYLTILHNILFLIYKKKVNAGHQILANFGEIVGLSTIDECMQNDEIVSFFNHVQRCEIVPHVAEVPGMKPQNYVELVADLSLIHI